jgi:hypothetical protein
MTNNQKRNCIFLSHISTGDNFTVYPIICEIHQKYENFHIFTLYRNRKFIKQLFENHDNIIIHELDENHNFYHPPENQVLDLIKKIPNCDLIVTGFYNYLGFPQRKHNILPFYREFYDMVNLDYDKLKNEHRKINRNFMKELELYNRLIERYGKDYIFVHDHRHIDYKHYGARPDVKVRSELDIPIFHPNINFYIKDRENKYYKNWDKNLISDNIMDYGMIIENAKEIYITDSSFCCLCTHLNLKNVSKKEIFVPSGINIRDYDQTFNDWLIQ